MGESRVRPDQDGMEYIRDLLRQLRDNALSEREYTLGYLIEMAYLEAADLLRERRTGR